MCPSHAECNVRIYSPTNFQFHFATFCFCRYIKLEISFKLSAMTQGVLKYLVDLFWGYFPDTDFVVSHSDFQHVLLSQRGL